MSKKALILLSTIVTVCVILWRIDSYKKTQAKTIILASCISNPLDARETRYAVTDLQSFIKKIRFYDTTLERQALGILESHLSLVEIIQTRLDIAEKMQDEAASDYARKYAASNIDKIKKDTDMLNKSTSEKLKTILSLLK